MQTLQGIANKVRFSTEVSGSDNSTSTNHVAVFELNGQSVEIKLPSSIIINNGDSVVVAGDIKRGLFKALAYKNLATQVSGKNNVILYYLLGAIFSVVGLATALIGVGLIFLAIGIYLIYFGAQCSKAYEMVINI